ncbi:MAG: phosphoribosylglycinamide formyltransferase [Treponema sp.]|jgi:phosphoribosylglycinamide formyltransferase-1|nr:phosphoribosylglycinamide formyltransferase [Treponema sp.]
MRDDVDTLGGSDAANRQGGRRDETDKHTDDAPLCKIRLHVERAAILVSGGGTNLQAIIDAKERGELPHADIALVVSSDRAAFALERAKKAGIQQAALDESDYTHDGVFDDVKYDDDLSALLRKNNIDIVVLAGFLVIVGSKVLDLYKNRIINVHPSLIPSFCGDGFYGLFVHEAALKRGVKISGATVHFVNEITDGGKIIMQRAVEVVDGDTPETLQRRVMEQAEWIILPRALEALCAGKLE